MESAVKKMTYRNYSIDIHTDDSPENPVREWDVLGKFICWHRRYDLGNCTDFANPQEVREYAQKTGSLLFPLYMYDHSGIGLSLDNSYYPYNCPWDAGQVGYVLVDRQEALKRLGKKRMSAKLRKRICQIIQAEVDTYNQYLSGDVYGYVISKDGKQIDSCWGYYGMEDVEEQARLVVGCHICGFKIYPHLLRHSMAHQFLKDTENDIVSLAQILGHENLNTTARYTQRTSDQLAQAAERLSY